VDDLVVALGIEPGISKSEVSCICAELDTVVGESRERRLDHIASPYLFLDATYITAHARASVVAKVAERHYLAAGSMALLEGDTGALGPADAYLLAS
jgi:transposase-like protein